VGYESPVKRFAPLALMKADTGAFRWEEMCIMQKKVYSRQGTVEWGDNYIDLPVGRSI
jgi:hypothetical protein